MTSLQQLNIESFKEGNRLEAKLAKDGVPASLWEAYTSFANTDGGLILLGVKENKNHTFAIEGIDNPEQMEKAFWDGVNNKRVVNINLLSNSDVEIKEVDGKTIIAIHVPRAERIYRSVYKGQDMFTGTYRRNGEGDYLCSREEVAAIFRDAGQVTQDNKLIVEVNLDALCKETITHYRRRFMLVHQGHVWNNLSEVYSQNVFDDRHWRTCRQWNSRCVFGVAQNFWCISRIFAAYISRPNYYNTNPC